MLFQLMKVENNDVSHLENTTKENLTSHTCDGLKVFIIVRTNKILKRGFPKKGQLNN